jgi:hypothetical protein
MDILLLKTAMILGHTFVFIFIGGIATVFTCAHLHKQNQNKLAKSIGKYLLGVIVTYISLTGAVHFALHETAKQKFYSLTTQNKMLVYKTDGIVEINDQTAISEFIDIVRASKGVLGHHSSPINKISFDFPEIGYSYTIGQDSKNTNEFWLEWNRYPNRKENWLAQIGVKQFYSDEMGSWLGKTLKTPDN